MLLPFGETWERLEPILPRRGKMAPAYFVGDRYSTDIAAAWKVVAKLEARGWSVVTRTRGVRGGRRCEITVPRPDGSGDWLFSDEAPTLPEAICRAALEAVESSPASSGSAKR